MVWILDALGWWIIPIGLIGSWAMWALSGLGAFESEQERADYRQGVVLAGAVLLLFLMMALLQAR